MNEFNDFRDETPIPTATLTNPIPIASIPPSRSTAKIAGALSKAQGSFLTIQKTKTASFPTKTGGIKTYQYADLADVIEAIRKGLAENELSVSHSLEHRRSFGLVTRLLHSSGEALESWYPLPDPANLSLKPQDFGAALTYARRYSVEALVGVSGEEDTDGENAAPVTEKKPARTAPRGPVIAPSTGGTNDVRLQAARILNLAAEKKWKVEEVVLLLSARYGVKAGPEDVIPNGMERALTPTELTDLLEILSTKTYKWITSSGFRSTEAPGSRGVE